MALGTRRDGVLGRRRAGLVFREDGGWAGVLGGGDGVLGRRGMVF